MHQNSPFWAQKLKTFLGHCSLPRSLPNGKGDTSSPHPTPLGAFGTSIDLVARQPKKVGQHWTTTYNSGRFYSATSAHQALRIIKIIIIIIIIIIISMTLFMVLSSWQSHCESSPGSFDECRRWWWWWWWWWWMINMSFWMAWTSTLVRWHWFSFDGMSILKPPLSHIGFSKNWMQLHLSV